MSYYILDESDRRSILADIAALKNATGLNTGGGVVSLNQRRLVQAESIFVPPAPSLIPAKITAVASDYITVKRIDAEGVVIGEPFYAAKPEKLRHDAALYPTLTTLSTDAPNAVTASDGAIDETWVVIPNLAADDVVLIAPVSYSGVDDPDDGTKQIRWILTGEFAWAASE